MSSINGISQHFFCFGLGYTGEALARVLLARGWRVSGTCRDPVRADRLKGLGINVHLFDGKMPLHNATKTLAEVDYLLSSVPPDKLGEAVLDHHSSDIAAMSERLAWIGYLSTTGVYGNRNGEWVDENSSLLPSSDRSQRRVEAEERWLSLGRGSSVPTHIFRLAGIYGPGRSMLDRIRLGRAQLIHRPGQVFSRIHVSDIITVLQASFANRPAGGIYNVCDDEPAAPADVAMFACNLLATTPPPLVDYSKAELSDMAKTFWADNKRVRNGKIKQKLGVKLQFPNYRAGLLDIHESEIKVN